MDPQEIAELRGTLATPGWQVATRVLATRLELVKRMLLVDETARPPHNTSARLRAEAALIHAFLTRPFELIQSYDRLATEVQDPQLQDWINRAMDEGMRYAGLPQGLDNPGEPHGE